MAVVELAIPARPAYLSLVRLVVDAAVGSLAPGLSAARLDDLKIVVTEACSNAIEANDEWLVGRSYISQKSMSTLWDSGPKESLPNKDGKEVELIAA